MAGVISAQDRGALFPNTHVARFVGECYSQLVSLTYKDTNADASHEPIFRELTPGEGPVDTIEKRWLAADEEIIALWNTLVQGVVSDQQRTMTALHASAAGVSSSQPAPANRWAVRRFWTISTRLLQRDNRRPNGDEKWELARN
jgi:hypothetical protein